MSTHQLGSEYCRKHASVTVTVCPLELGYTSVWVGGWRTPERHTVAENPESAVEEIHALADILLPLDRGNTVERAEQKALEYRVEGVNLGQPSDDGDFSMGPLSEFKSERLSGQDPVLHAQITVATMG